MTVDEPETPVHQLIPGSTPPTALPPISPVLEIPKSLIFPRKENEAFDWRKRSRVSFADYGQGNSAMPQVTFKN